MVCGQFGGACTGVQNPGRGWGVLPYMGYIGMCCCEGYGFQAVHSGTGCINLARVVQTLDSAIHQINHYPAHSVIDLRNTYPLDSDLSGG